MQTTDRTPTQEEINYLTLVSREIPVISYTFDLTAIWLSNPIITDQGKTYRIKPGMRIRVDNNNLGNINSDNPATHSIIKIKGMSNCYFSIFALHLLTNEIQIIKI